MVRVPRLPWLLWLLPLLPIVAGCGAAATSLPPAHAASPQRAVLDWTERFGDATGGIEYGVSSFEVTSTGWRAQVSIANRTAVPFAVGGTAAADAERFGLRLFATRAHSELESRNSDGQLPTVRAADGFAPPLPRQLAPNAVWSGTISAPGPLAAGAWVRISFPPLIALTSGGQGGAPAPRLPDVLSKAHADQGLVWITDHAYELRR